MSRTTQSEPNNDALILRLATVKTVPFHHYNIVLKHLGILSQFIIEIR